MLGDRQCPHNVVVLVYMDIATVQGAITGWVVKANIYQCPN